MQYKWLNAILVGIKEYKSKLFQKKYIVNYQDNKRYNISEKNKKYNIDMNRDKYGVCYCISYKPVGEIEWLLLRGWWNDRGIWTEDGIFNDGII